MASVRRHLSSLEEHARLPFNRDCPLCQARLAGVLPAPPLINPRLHAGMLAGALTIGTLLPATEAIGREAPARLDMSREGDPPAVLVAPPPSPTDGDAGVERRRTGAGEPTARQLKPPRVTLDEPVTPRPGAPRLGTSPPGTERAPVGRAPRQPDPGKETPKSPSAGVRQGTSGNGSAATPANALRAIGPSRRQPLSPEPEGASGISHRHAAGSINASPPRRQSRPERDRGQRVHLIQPGECLWTIAERRLNAGASHADVAQEVERLWVLNAGEVGTGDPNLIYPGQRLRL